MAKNDDSARARNWLAYGTLIFSGLAIVVLAIWAIRYQPGDTMHIFNVVLPVFASWVGTILAFYFGRENFESANKRVQELVQQMTPEQRGRMPVSSIMKPLSSMAHFKMQAGKDDEHIKVLDLISVLSNLVTRLPIVNADGSPRYMIHASSIDKYLAGEGKPEDTLKGFLTWGEGEGFVFGEGRGFVVVAEDTSVGNAKRQMEQTPSCQDIFVTKKGNKKEPLIGWISNVRLARELEK